MIRIAGRPVLAAHLDRRLEVEATHTGFAFPAGLAVVVGVGALGGVFVGTAACGRAGESQRERVLHRTVVLEGSALEELVHALGDGGAERLELGARGRGERHEGTENVEKQAVEVHHVLGVLGSLRSLCARSPRDAARGRSQTSAPR
ncbi:MAG: hypothetical protein OHK0013_46650 [Sandaracinaceae bacterium]